MEDFFSGIGLKGHISYCRVKEPALILAFSKITSINNMNSKKKTYEVVKYDNKLLFKILFIWVLVIYTTEDDHRE